MCECACECVCVCVVRDAHTRTHIQCLPLHALLCTPSPQHNTTRNTGCAAHCKGNARRRAKARVSRGRNGENRGGGDDDDDDDDDDVHVHVHVHNDMCVCACVQCVFTPSLPHLSLTSPSTLPHPSALPPFFMTHCARCKLADQNADCRANGAGRGRGVHR